MMVRLHDVAVVHRVAATEPERRCLPYVGLEDIEKERGGFVPSYDRRPQAALSSNVRFSSRHVLYGKLRPYLNKVALPDFDGVCTTEILPIAPRNGDLDRRYLWGLLLSSPFVAWASARVHGANLPRLDPELLGEYEFDLPSIATQQRIAAQLAEADRLRRMRRYALELSDGLAGTVFRELFDRERLPAVSVEELAADAPNAIRTGPFGSQLLHSEFTDQGVAVLGIDNVVSNRFEWSERRFITDEKFSRLKRYTVHPGDVLITIMGTCGRCAVVPGEIETAINTKHLCCITLNHARCLPAFLHGAFLYDPFVRGQLKATTKGAIMDGLNMEIIKGLRIRLPALRAQQHYGSLVAQHERLRAQQVEALRQAEHIFRTLLHRAFA